MYASRGHLSIQVSGTPGHRDITLAVPGSAQKTALSPAAQGPAPRRFVKLSGLRLTVRRVGALAQHTGFDQTHYPGPMLFLFYPTSHVKELTAGDDTGPDNELERVPRTAPASRLASADIEAPKSM